MASNFGLYKVPYENYGEEGLRLLLAAVDRFGSDVRAYRQLAKIRAYLSPGKELILFAYTEEAMYDQDNSWGPIERVSRGLMLHWPTRTVHAWPYNKFFNYGQRPETTLASLNGYRRFQVTAKLDGSMGVGYYNEAGEPCVATKAQFVNEQAEWATAWVRERGIRWDPYLTPVFEIIYPANQVVLTYPAEMTGLHLHGVRDLRTGRELDYEEVSRVAAALSVPVVPSYPVSSVMDLVNRVPNLRDIEGFVVTFPDFLRIKLKTAEYLELHRVVTNYRPGRIIRWTAYLEPDQVEELISRFPDELYEEAQQVRKGFLSQVASLEEQVLTAYQECLAGLPPGASQKEFAAAAHVKAEETGLARAYFFELHNNVVPARFKGLLMEQVTGIRGLSINRYNVFKHFPEPEQRLRYILKQDQEDDTREAEEAAKEAADVAQIPTFTPGL